MVVDHVLLAHLSAVHAPVVSASKVRHHALLLLTTDVFLAIVMMQVTLRFHFDRTARALDVSFFAMSIAHMLHVITSSSKSPVTFNAFETPFLVLINVVHTHGACLLVMTVETAFGTINMSTHLLIPLYLLRKARAVARRFSLNW